MILASSFKNSTLDEIKAALAGGKLAIYSVARPSSPDRPVQRSGLLATFVFASPAFADGATAEESGSSLPAFAANPVVASGVGTPGFARAFKADGTTVVADFSVGAGNTDIKLSEVSTTAKFPIRLNRLNLELPIDAPTADVAAAAAPTGLDAAAAAVPAAPELALVGSVG